MHITSLRTGPPGRPAARLLTAVLALLLMLGTASWLAPQAGAWTSYSTVYRTTINEIRNNVSAPMRENVRAMTNPGGYYAKDITGLGRGGERIRVIFSREDLYIRGFLLPDRRDAPQLILFGNRPDAAAIRTAFEIPQDAGVDTMHFGDTYANMIAEANRGLPLTSPDLITLPGLTITRTRLRDAIQNVAVRPADNDAAARRTRARSMLTITVAIAEGTRITGVSGVNADGGGGNQGLFDAFANSGWFTDTPWTVGEENRRRIQGGWDAATTDAWGWLRDATFQPQAGHELRTWGAVAAAFAVLGRCGGGGGNPRVALAADTCPAGAPVDAATSVGGNEAYLFHGPFNARVKYQIGGSGDTFTEGPQSIYESWPLLRGTPFVLGVDSALYRQTTSGASVYFTKGSNAIMLKNTQADLKSAGQVAYSGTICGLLGLCQEPFASGIDSMVAAENDGLYVFAGGQYARLSLSDGKWQTMYIKDIKTEWPVLAGTPFADRMDAVFSQIPSGSSDSGSMRRLMMFSGSQYVRVLADVNGHGDTIENGPMSICEGWPLLCGTMFDPVPRIRITARDGSLPPDDNQLPADPTADPDYRFGWVFDDGRLRNKANGKCLDVDTLDRDGRADGGRIHQWGCLGSPDQSWQGAAAQADGSVPVVSAHSGKCLDVEVSTGTVRQWACGGGANQLWFQEQDRLRNKQTGTCLASTGGADGLPLAVAPCPAPGQVRPDPTAAGDPVDPTTGTDDGGPRPARPASQAACRPDGMATTPGTDTRYCDVYQGDGREWLGQDRTRRVVGYFTGWRTGQDGSPRYLVKNVPWNKLTHLNYAFASVDQGNRIAVGDDAVKTTWPGVAGAEMDPGLPYQGHFNLLTRYKRQHPRVKTMISVGGWATSSGFYAMTTNADGTVNQGGIDTFASSVVDFLARYGFDGVDVDYEYPTALPDAGNPTDWAVSNPRRKGLGAGYNALMKTLREKLDRSGHYYLLTSAGSASGYLVRGQENQPALQYQDFVNVMSYDLHGSWNYFVGPQAPLYDDGNDPELAVAGIYDGNEYRRTGYFNTDWAYHYYRGALQPGRINLGIPLYTRGWRDVQGGTDGLWGASVRPDQANCPPGTGGKGGRVACGSGAVGIDNLWHDTEGGQEVPAGSNPLWHARNLQDGRQPGYSGAYGLTPGTDPDDRLTGGYARKWDDRLKASWLWNAEKKVFLSTEDEQSVAAKTQYVIDKGIGGVMLWELAGDYAQRPGGEYGMGYTLTSQIDQALRGKPAYGDTRAARPLPSQAVDVKVELAGFPTGLQDLWPMQPKLRITNNSTVRLGPGTEVSFDVPTSTPALFKGQDWKELPGVVPGHTGPNAGGLTGDFHRITVKLGYCEDIAPGEARDIELKYYLPITGPANVVLRINGTDYGSTGDLRRGTTTVTPPQPTGGACQAAPWQRGQAYSPTGGRLWSAWDKGAQGWQFEYQGQLMDHYPEQNRVHLVEPITTNPNQYWKVEDAGGGWSRITNGGRCLGAVTPRTDLASGPCTGADAQKWRFVPVDVATGAEGTPAAKPVHGQAVKLRSATGFDAEAANGSTARLTHIWAGDPAGSSAAYTSWQGYYWYAQWWTQAEPGTAEPNGSSPWRRLGRV